MIKEFSAFLTIIGMVVGSGFISGKEVVVFFSRFGGWSFVGIILSFFIFFLLFKLILFSQNSLVKYNSSCFAKIVNIILCTIFSSAMMGGINNLLNFSEKWINYLIFLLILLICLLIFLKGSYFFNKLNFIFVPLMVVVFVVMLLSNIAKPSWDATSHGELSIFYSLLYCLLNSANGCVILLPLSKTLSKKQKTRVAFFSALVLSLLLLLANVFLLSCPSALSSPMPLLEIFSGGTYICMTVVVGLGCLTTLFSLVYSCSCSFRGLCKKEFVNFFVSVILPSMISLLGFSSLVEFLYPLASILGGALLMQLFFIPLFKRGNKKIHAGGKNTKKENACHDNIKF